MNGDPARPDYQRRQYDLGFYQRWRKIRWLFRYDCRYRLFLMEELFKKHQIPFERMKVYELGFGTGDLLFRFDATSCLHGCEVSKNAIAAIQQDQRLGRYPEWEFVQGSLEGHPRFPSNDYDLVIASHVIEHVPNDACCLRSLAEHTRPEGLGLFFLPLERPGHLPALHARTYTAAGFDRLLCENGWEPIDLSENFRYASHWVQVYNWPSRRRIPVLGKLVETTKNFLLSLPPTSFVWLMEQPLAALHVAPMQLTVLARRSARQLPAESDTKDLMKSSAFLKS